MASLSEHGTELARTEYTDCRVAVMSDGSVLRNQGYGWKRWKRVKAGVDPVAFAAKMRTTYDARPAEFHAYIRALVAACDLEHRAQLNALVDQMPEDPQFGVCSTIPTTNCRLKTSYAAAGRERCWTPLAPRRNELRRLLIRRSDWARQNRVTWIARHSM